MIRLQTRLKPDIRYNRIMPSSLAKVNNRSHVPPARINDAHLNHLREHGYVVVPAFLTEAELKSARQNMLRYVPTAEELAAAPERYPWVFEEADRLQTEFPFTGDALNHVATHPEMISFA